MVHQQRLILCAEDDVDDQILFKEAFQAILPNGSFTLHFANNGQEAIQFLEGTAVPDILFLDLNMPKKDGMSSLKEIRSNERFDIMPVAIFSTSANDKDILASFEHGANFYAVKPMLFSELCRIVTTCLERALNNRQHCDGGASKQPGNGFVID